MVTATDPAATRDSASGDRLLRHGLACMGVQLSPPQREALDVYLSELLRWAPRVNLTALASREAIIREGFLRSLTYRAAFEPAPRVKAVDIGSGAGFPGLVLKIAYPEIDMLLIEAARRRATFLRSLIRRLGLTGIRCLQVRAEQLHGDASHRGTYRVAFARAVGALPDIVSLAEPFLSPGGRLILHVGRKTPESLGPMQPRLASLGMRAAMYEAPAVEPGGPPTRLLIVEKAGPAAS